jgi:hypothetical protein
VMGPDQMGRLGYEEAVLDADPATRLA